MMKNSNKINMTTAELRNAALNVRNDLIRTTQDRLSEVIKERVEACKTYDLEIAELEEALEILGVGSDGNEATAEKIINYLMKCRGKWVSPPEINRNLEISANISLVLSKALAENRVEKDGVWYRVP